MRKVGGPEVKRHVLVDGNNLVHRAHYAFVESRLKRGQPLLSTPDGFPTGLLHGFLSTLGSWLREIGDFSSLSCFFDGRPVRRKSLDPSYKSGRADDSVRGVRMGDESLPSRTFPDGTVVRGEMGAIVRILPMLGCAVYWHPEEEADDLIASFCRSDPGSVRVIVSSDRDFFQLLDDPRVVCYVPGTEGDRFFDGERSAQYWEKSKSVRVRVEPSSVRMFKALCGDSSDSVRGVHGLRKKVAVPLCHHRTVEELLASGLPGWSDGEKSLLTASADRIRTNLELVSLREGLDLGECLLHRASPDQSALSSVLDSLRMASFDPSGFPVALAPSPPPPRPHDGPPPPVPLDPWMEGI